jgi:maltooligosyltrehalose trehalohydrolase
MTSVWSPSATRVAVTVDGTRHDLRQGDSGWWHLDGVSIPHGAEYGFLLDDADAPLPDPRSRWQPHGVHALSRWYDTRRFHWHDDAWTGKQLAGSVVYELHVGTFTPVGTLDAAINMLDHVVDLGIDFVELLPVNAFAGHHNWGYDGVLWYAVDQSYGGPVAYQRFVDACHGRGLGVIQDVVYNHLGPSGNYLPRFGPYLHPERTSPWGPAVNLDEPAVRRYVLDNACMWLREYHVDGLRLDAVHALVDPSPKHLLAELAEEVDALSAHLGRPLTLIAESDQNDPMLTTPREAGGLGIHAQWNDDFHHALHVALTGETTGYYGDFEHPDALVKVVTGGFFHDGTYSSFRGRPHGSPIDADTAATWRLVVAAQNHDQIGNRAAGDRLSASLDDGRLAIAAVLTLTAPFTPMLFMGEEWAATTPWQFFTSHTDPELARATAQGRIDEFARMGWDRSLIPDPQDPATFAASTLDWSELADDRHARFHALYRELLRLRRQRPDLTDPRYTTTSCHHDDTGRFVIERGTTQIVVNLAAVPVRVDCAGTVLLATDPGVTPVNGGIEMPPNSAAVLAAADGRP